MTPFPLLRLPCIAFAKVVNQLEIHEKLCLLWTSQNTKRLINSVSKPKINISIEDYDHENRVGILVHHMDHPVIRFTIFYSLRAPTWHTSLKFGKHPIPVVLIHLDSFKTVKVFHQTRQEGFEEVLNFLKESFEIDFVNLDLRCEDPEKSSKLVETVKRNAGKILNFSWRPNEDSEDDASRKILEAAAYAKAVVLEPRIDSNFQFDGFDKYALKILYIHKGPWMTSNHLCDLVKCSKITINDTELTSLDFNLFLKYLMENNVEIRKWQIHTIKVLDPAMILNGLESSRKRGDKWILQKPDGIKYKINIDPGEMWRGGFYINRM